MEPYFCHTSRVPQCGCCPLQLKTPGRLQHLDCFDVIEGLTHPHGTVIITIDNNCPLQVVADENGVFQIENPYALSPGPHGIRVCTCPYGCCVCHIFFVNEQVFRVEAIEARMGAIFRTVDVDVLIAGACGAATVHYLLLPPGSPAATAEEILSYNNTAALIDGTAACGQFETTIQSGERLYTWPLTGLDNPNAPPGTTGVIDGYRYDVYLYIDFECHDSVLLSFPEAAMGMPFATGHGTEDDPFTIRELTPEELAQYPDLLADNPLNVPGVDETARMLENIERLITLYEATDGYYGLEESMTFHYLMTSDIDLAGYAAAYGGEGWESIGDIDGWINDRKETEHLFSGVLDGGGHTITNLSITPTATADNFVGYRGLFGGVEEGTIRDLTLSGVTISAFATPPGQAEFGSFISIARKPTLIGLSLQGATIVADIGPISIGDTHAVNVGGFVGEIYEGGTIRDITGQNISITVPSQSALALGGFVGFTDKFDGYESYENIKLSNVTISGYALIGGLAGYVVYGVNLVDQVTIRQITITAPGGESGGLIGRLYVYAQMGDCLIDRCEVQNVAIFINGQGDPGAANGGLIGLIEENPWEDDGPPPKPDREIFKPRVAVSVPVATLWPMTTVQRSSVKGGQVNCSSNGGGLIGWANVAAATAEGRVLVTLCKTKVTTAAVLSNAGGLVGFAQNLRLDQSFSAGDTTAGENTPGGVAGLAVASVISNCYATGESSGGFAAGGIAATANASDISTCYSAGDVIAQNYAGGICGTMPGATVRSNLVLGGVISAYTPHRIAGTDSGSGTLTANYALDTVMPMPGVPDQNGLDGGTITDGQIVSTMQALGWDTAVVWDSATVATLGRPTLRQNPE